MGKLSCMHTHRLGPRGFSPLRGASTHSRHIIFLHIRAILAVGPFAFLSSHLSESGKQTSVCLAFLEIDRATSSFWGLLGDPHTRTRTQPAL